MLVHRLVRFFDMEARRRKTEPQLTEEQVREMGKEENFSPPPFTYNTLTYDKDAAYRKLTMREVNDAIEEARSVASDSPTDNRPANPGCEACVKHADWTVDAYEDEYEPRIFDSFFDVLPNIQYMQMWKLRDQPGSCVWSDLPVELQSRILSRLTQRDRLACCVASPQMKEVLEYSMKKIHCFFIDDDNVRVTYTDGRTRWLRFSGDRKERMHLRNEWGAYVQHHTGSLRPLRAFYSADTDDIYDQSCDVQGKRSSWKSKRNYAAVVEFVRAALDGARVCELRIEDIGRGPSWYAPALLDTLLHLPRPIQVDTLVLHPSLLTSSKTRAAAQAFVRLCAPRAIDIADDSEICDKQVVPASFFSLPEVVACDDLSIRFLIKYDENTAMDTRCKLSSAALRSLTATHIHIEYLSRLLTIQHVVAFIEEWCREERELSDLQLVWPSRPIGWETIEGLATREGLRGVGQARSFNRPGRRSVFYEMTVADKCGQLEFVCDTDDFFPSYEVSFTCAPSDWRERAEEMDMQEQEDEEDVEEEEEESEEAREAKNKFLLDLRNEYQSFWNDMDNGMFMKSDELPVYPLHELCRWNNW